MRSYCEDSSFQQAKCPGHRGYRSAMVMTTPTTTFRRTNILLSKNNRINTLPVTNDEEAAPYAYGYLVELIEQ